MPEENKRTLVQCFLNFFGLVHPYHRFLGIIHPRYINNTSRTYNENFVKGELQPKRKSFFLKNV